MIFTLSPNTDDVTGESSVVVHLIIRSIRQYPLHCPNARKFLAFLLLINLKNNTDGEMRRLCQHVASESVLSYQRKLRTVNLAFDI